ncbi:hypothetical protein WH47_09398 [Habropoda laboriosa]|uniref:DUF4781 domain-containing protein n=1 Tax=Habropoda laboriosa TaxID=597456 RepID=A0A0L7RF26_9HYME|nr:hypothetical protein WH47_09398 [Habropoda laboriosa]
MKHKIGYALFGPPDIDKNMTILTTFESSVSENDQLDNIFDTVYDKNMCKAINAIYVQIMNHGKRCSDNFIYLGVIFNIILLHKDSKKLSKENDKSCKEANSICALPVFKVKKDNSTVWYIDSESRVYDSWNDYIKNNTLPKCTMVFPKDGFYQCNPFYTITKYTSSVWVESMDSPACSARNTVLKGIDVAANVVSVCAGVGLGITSLLTPVAPVLLTAGVVHAGVSGSWIVGRNVQKLVDLATHKQSVNVTNKNAFTAWLGIGSSVLTFGASGGTMLLSKAITSGRTITTAAEIAYNSVLLSNLTVNGIGIVFQGYCLIDKYQTQKEIDMLDVIVFTSHILFFSNTLINVKLASQLVQTSQGTILEKIKNALRLNRFDEEFGKRQIFMNSNKTNEENQSGGIVCKAKEVTNVEDFCSSLPNMTWNNGKIFINNKMFIDPIVFTGRLLSIGACTYNLIQSNSSALDYSENNNVIIKLKNALKEKIRNYYADKQPLDVQLPDVSYFNIILREIKYTNNPLEILTMIFKISVTIMKYSSNPAHFLFDAIYFTWTYCKANLKEYGVTAGSSTNKQVYNTVTNIVHILHDSIDEVANELFIAFYTYMSSPRENVFNSV